LSNGVNATITVGGAGGSGVRRRHLGEEHDHDGVGQEEGDLGEQHADRILARLILREEDPGQQDVDVGEGEQDEEGVQDMSELAARAR
jgi:hypothetical protein